MEEKKIVSISLFSGAGGLDIASFLAGVPVVSSTDLDSDCIKTLKMTAIGLSLLAARRASLFQRPAIGWETVPEKAPMILVLLWSMSICA